MIAVVHEIPAERQAGAASTTPASTRFQTAAAFPPHTSIHFATMPTTTEEATKKRTRDSSSGGSYTPADSGLPKYFLPMLDDADRNATYGEAIKRCIAEFKAAEGRECAAQNFEVSHLSNIPPHTLSCGAFGAVTYTRVRVICVQASRA